MKPIRTIEKLAYGEGTPDGLADLVPSWEDLWDSPYGEGEIWIGNCEDRVFSVEETPHGIAVNAPSPLEARWLAGCIIAHKAGCPPHWVDMGFKAGWGWNSAAETSDICWRRQLGKKGIVNAFPGWGVYASSGGPFASHECDTELEARQYAYDLIKEMEQ